MTIRLLSNDALQDLKAEAFAMVHAYLPPPDADGCWDDRSFTIAMMKMVDYYFECYNDSLSDMSEAIGKDGSPYWSPDAITEITHFTQEFEAALGIPIRALGMPIREKHQ